MIKGTLALFSILYLSMLNLSYSQSAGSLDMSFNSIGYVLANINGTTSIASKVLTQTDGKILVIGTCQIANLGAFAVVRYNIDGTLDNTFNTNGIFTLKVGTTDDGVTSAALQSDGKIVITGFSKFGGQPDITVVRINSNGTIDNSFNGNGFVTTSIGDFDDYPTSLAILPNGKILVGGFYKDSQLNRANCLLQYNSNGSLDNSFGIGGIVSTQINYSDDRIFDLIVQPDGKIVTAGYTLNTSSTHEISLIRYSSDGLLDVSFDNDGIVTTNISNHGAFASSMQLLEDGKILIAGKTYNGSNYDLLLVKYNVDGSLDNSFNSNGIVVQDYDNSENHAYSLAIQSDQKILVAGATGSVTNVNPHKFILIRYNADGSVDEDFGNIGVATTEIGIPINAYNSVTIQNDGKILATGYATIDAHYQFVLVRYNEQTLGINETTIESSINFYPNPTNGLIKITDENNSINKIEIYDFKGELMNQVCSNWETIDLSNYLSGYYLLKIFTDSEINIRKIMLSKF